MIWKTTSHSLPAAFAAVLAFAASAHAQAPYLVKDFPPASPDPFCLPGVNVMLGAVEDRVFFSARTAEQGCEVWTSLGTPETTVAVEATPGPTSSTNPRSPIATLGGSILFSSLQGPWRTDGTRPGTEQLADVEYSTELPGAVNGGLALFGGRRGGYTEPLRSDGTPQGTDRLAAFDRPVYMYRNARPLAFKDGFGFLADVASPFQPRPWRSDGSVEGTRPIPSMETAVCPSLVAVGENLAFACLAGIPSVPALFWSDGTGTGTRVVTSLPAVAFWGPDSMVNAEGRVYFLVPDGSGMGEIWTSDGTAAGTRRLSDVAPVAAGLRTLYLIPSSDVVYFLATTAAAGRELWRTDGTAAGTFMLRDIEPGPGNGFPDEGTSLRPMLPVPGGLVFSAFSSATGPEVWMTDGTPAGTRLLGETVPGPASEYPWAFQRAGRRVFFLSQSDLSGNDLWAIDLPAAVLSVDDVTVTEGDASSFATFTVRLTAPSTQAVTVSYATADGTAVSGLDFTAAAGTLTFPPGTQEQTVDVAILGDLRDEADESFALVLSAPVGGSIGDGRGVAVVLDDDVPAVRLAGPVVVTEGNAGTTDAVFTVVLTTRSGRPTAREATVGFATEDGTAQAGALALPDYQATSGIVTFPADTASGATATVRVPVVGDTFDEADEYFELLLQPYGGNAAADRQPVRGTIRDDDGSVSGAPVELTHGSVLWATLTADPGGTPDQDHYVSRADYGASYEVIVDEVSGDAQPLELVRTGPSGAGVSQTATAVGTGNSLSLRWWSQGVPPQDFVRVANPACGSACGDDDRYRLRYYETTLTAPRFNNVGTQRSVVILQNPSSSSVAGRQQYWDEYGAGIHDLPFSIEPYGTFVFDTSTAAPQRSGSITFAHDAPYGVLTGKVVTIDPATGLSMDTPITSKPR